MAPIVWAVDVSRWNAPPYTRVQPRGAPNLDAHTAELDRLVDELVRPYDAPGAARVQQYLRPIDRVRSLVARLLPRLYCAQAGDRWADVRIETAPGGRPYVAHRGAHLDWNLTHDGDWVVLAVTHTPGVRVGVDVMELALPSFEESSASFCRTMAHAMTPREHAYVDADAEQQLQRLLDLWTYKEAYTKSIGEGLGCDFQRVEVAFWESPIAIRVRGARVPRVQFVEVQLAPARAGAAPSQVAIALEGAEDPTRLVADAAEAAAQGWLRRWGFDELLAAARRAARAD